MPKQAPEVIIKKRRTPKDDGWHMKSFKTSEELHNQLEVLKLIENISFQDFMEAAVTKALEPYQAHIRVIQQQMQLVPRQPS